MSAGAFMWRARNLAGAATSLRELTTEAVSALKGTASELGRTLGAVLSVRDSHKSRDSATQR